MRVTPQRAHVWRLLAESGGHLTAEALWERAKRTLPGLELSTVYRALEALGEVGLVVDSSLPGGPKIFEAHPVAHPHMVCDFCGGISHPELEVGRQMLEALSAGSGGFEVRALHAVALGVCAGCAGQGEGKS